MDDNIQKPKRFSYLLLIATFIQLIIIIFVVVSFQRIPRDDINTDEYISKMSISIDNISEVFPNLDKNDIKIIENDLYESVSRNTASSVNFSENKAQIRKGTECLLYFENEGLNYFSAIVDIPSLNQSYQIFMSF